MDSVVNKRKRSRAKKKAFSVYSSDPLFMIFEKQLYDFEYNDKDSFVEEVVSCFFELITKKNISFPVQEKMELKSNAFREVRQMLTYKIYGCLTVIDDKKSKPKKLKFLHDPNMNLQRCLENLMK